jgi:hypothetical protein
MDIEVTKVALRLFNQEAFLFGLTIPRSPLNTH